MADGLYAARLAMNRVAEADATAVKKPVIEPGTVVAQSALRNFSNKPTVTKETPIVKEETGIHPAPPHPMILKDADQDVMINVIKAAKRQGVDPYTALAIGAQETGMRKDLKNNPLFNNSSINLTKAGGPHPEAIDDDMKFLKQKFELGKRLGKTNEADLIQGWNGYGKLPQNVDMDKISNEISNEVVNRGYEAESDMPKEEHDDMVNQLYKKYRKPTIMYGIDINGIDFNKNPIYGKRIIDIRENRIKKDPKIVALVNSIK